jgi:hypothetical protein
LIWTFFHTHTSTFYTQFFVSGYRGKSQNRIMGDQPSAFALRPGRRVGPAGPFSPVPQPFMAGSTSFRSHKRVYHGQWANGGKGVKNRYLGLKFDIQGKVHFGWARLGYSASTRTFTLTGYAYETIPNKSIIAGKTRGRDETEDVSLGALAAGAPLRGRRQK